MPSSGPQKGNLVLLKVDTFPIACSTALSVAMSADVIDATCKDNDGARNVLPGQKQWSVSLEGLQIWNDAHNIEELWDKFWTGAEVELSWSSGIVGDPIWSGDARISQLDLDFPLNDVCSYSATFEGDGVPSIDVVPE